MFSWLNFNRTQASSEQTGREQSAREEEVDGFVLVEEKTEMEARNAARHSTLAAAPPPYQHVAAPTPSSNTPPVPASQSGVSSAYTMGPAEVRSPISDVPFSLAAPLLVRQQLLHSTELSALLHSRIFDPSLYWYDFSLETQFLHDVDLSHQQNQQNAYRERQLVQ